MSCVLIFHIAIITSLHTCILSAEIPNEYHIRKNDKNFVPKTNYRSKYEHLIGTDSALEAARDVEAKKSYGMVSAELKKDKRTVEDIQAEIRAKKKMKLEQSENQPAP